MIFKKLHNAAKLPQRSTKHSAGLDVFSLNAETIYVGQTKIIRTGICFETTERDNLDHDWIGLYIRSSLAAKGLMLANGVGVIDIDYEDEIKVIIHNSGDVLHHIFEGEKIAQLVIQSHYSDEVMNITLKYNKRTGGLGSTNNE